MGKTGRDWMQLHATYGLEEWQSLVFLFLQASFFTLLAVLLLAYFDTLCLSLHNWLPFLPAGAPRFIAGFTGCLTALLAVCLFVAATNIWYSGVALHWEIAQRMVAMVPDWCSVKYALDVGCGRGILLNAVALQLKKEGSSGRVVGLDRRKTVSATLRTAAVEGVQEYVTCRRGDARCLPFSDNYFDVVVSAVFLHTVGKEHGLRSAAAAAERNKTIQEVVRVLKPGGTAVLWDLVYVPEYAQRLYELRMEDVRVSDCVTAFMMNSHIVSFRKPTHHPDQA